jgi:hypothetical protein
MCSTTRRFSSPSAQPMVIIALPPSPPREAPRAGVAAAHSGQSARLTFVTVVVEARGQGEDRHGFGGAPVLEQHRVLPHSRKHNPDLRLVQICNQLQSKSTPRSTISSHHDSTSVMLVNARAVKQVPGRWDLPGIPGVALSTLSDSSVLEVPGGRRSLLRRRPTGRYIALRGLGSVEQAHGQAPAQIDCLCGLRRA